MISLDLCLILFLYCVFFEIVIYSFFVICESFSSGLSDIVFIFIIFRECFRCVVGMDVFFVGSSD